MEKASRVVKIRQANLALARFLMYFFVLMLPLVHSAQAQTADLNTTISEEEKQQFNQVLTPVMKIYNFIKYTASVIAVIALLFAGISYMFSGNDVRKRDTSKNMAAYVFIGLTVIWAAPFVVNILLT